MKILQGLLLILLWFNLQATTDSLRYQLKIADHDSVRVKTLFALGNIFIDGPSDSLLYYYFRSLDVINKNLEKHPDNSAEYHTFKKLEYRARLELGIEYFFRSEFDRALEFFFQTEEIAHSIQNKSLLSESYSEIGIVLKNQGNYDEALGYQQKAIEIAFTLNEPDWVAICYVNIANIYKIKGYYSIAVENYLKALKIFEEMDQPRRVAACLHSIGELFAEQKNRNKALEYFEKGLEMAIESNDLRRVSDLTMAIGNVHYAMEKKGFALSHLYEGVRISKSIGNSLNLEGCYIALAQIYFDEGVFDSTLHYLGQASKIAGEEQDMVNLAEIKLLKGKIELGNGNRQKAINLFDEALRMAKECGHIIMQKDALEQLYFGWNAQGDNENALEYFIRFSQLKDSLFKAEQYRAIAEMEVKYETVKKEQNISLLTEQTKNQQMLIGRRNRLLWFFGILLILFAAGAILFIRYRKVLSTQKSVELENRLLRAQMNPHFIFNSLIAIQGFIYEKKPVEAGDFLARFADLVRLTLENSRNEFVLLEKEIGMIQVYLELQQLRFEQQFDFRIEVNTAIDPNTIKIPPMLGQPFIENAVEHGIRNKPDKGFIRVAISETEHKIEMIAEDDGIGREAAKKFRKSDRPGSLATSITAERLKVLGKKYRQKFLFEIEDLKDENNHPAGTRVRMQMPAEKAV